MSQGGAPITLVAIAGDGPRGAPYAPGVRPVGPELARWPSCLTARPFSSLVVGPRLGTTLTHNAALWELQVVHVNPFWPLGAEFHCVAVICPRTPCTLALSFTFL
jgi:hypothetical protein